VMGGGEIKLDGKAGPINAGDVEATPLTATLKIDKFDLADRGGPRRCRESRGSTAARNRTGRTRG
jgi:hypothetical protein